MISVSCWIFLTKWWMECHRFLLLLLLLLWLLLHIDDLILCFKDWRSWFMRRSRSPSIYFMSLIHFFLKFTNTYAPGCIIHAIFSRQLRRRYWTYNRADSVSTCRWFISQRRRLSLRSWKTQRLSSFS